MQWEGLVSTSMWTLDVLCPLIAEINCKFTQGIDGMGG